MQIAIRVIQVEVAAFDNRQLYAAGFLQPGAEVRVAAADAGSDVGHTAQGGAQFDVVLQTPVGNVPIDFTAEAGRCGEPGVLHHHDDRNSSQGIGYHGIEHLGSLFGQSKGEGDLLGGKGRRQTLCGSIRGHHLFPAGGVEVELGVVERQGHQIDVIGRNGLCICSHFTGDVRFDSADCRLWYREVDGELHDTARVEGLSLSELIADQVEHRHGLAAHSPFDQPGSVRHIVPLLLLAVVLNDRDGLVTAGNLDGYLFNCGKVSLSHTEFRAGY